MREKTQRKRRRKSRGIRRVSAGSALGAGSLGLLWTAGRFPAFADWYSRNVYSALVSVIGRVSGVFPFSVSELLLYILLILLAAAIVRTVRRCRKEGWKRATAEWICGIYLLAAILFFIYTVNCGINYNRVSFAETTGLDVRGGTAEELKAVCQKLTEDVNEMSGKVRRGEQGEMILSVDVQEEAVRAMEKLSGEYTCLGGFYPEPKGLFFSELLSVQQLTGIYSPFTIEANYNTQMTDYNIPFTACHELAHLRGFMQEEEANFIGYLAGIQSDSWDFRYSSCLMGWIYCTNALYDVDREAYYSLREQLDVKVRADLAVNSAFWERYDSPVAEVANQVNDTYLKANGQEEGVVSYDRMVELILAKEREDCSR